MAADPTADPMADSVAADSAEAALAAVVPPAVPVGEDRPAVLAEAASVGDAAQAAARDADGIDGCLLFQNKSV